MDIATEVHDRLLSLPPQSFKALPAEQQEQLLEKIMDRQTDRQTDRERERRKTGKRRETE